MNKREKQYNEAVEMLDDMCNLYNEANANNDDVKEISKLLFLAVLAAVSTGFKVEITTDKNDYIKRLSVAY